jgi:hypothetical protein
MDGPLTLDGKDLMMTDLWEFGSQEWISKEKELLRLANYKCAEGCDEEAKKVYVCYFLRDRRIWDLPKDAYKCYCKRHWTDRLKIDSEIRVRLAAFTIIDLDTLHRVLEGMAGIRDNKRAKMMEQLYVEAKNKHSRQDNFVEYTEDEIDEELED